MTQTNRFALTFETISELTTGLRPDRSDLPIGLPKLGEVLDEYSPLPDQSLFLGIAGDGLPVLLNLMDPLPGAILITGDSGSGKTRLLQTIARGVDLMHKSRNVKYVVLTGRPDEWDSSSEHANCDGLLQSASEETADYLGSLAKWAHESRDDRQAILLLIDDLEGLVSAGKSHQYLRWLFLSGPGRHVWPFVTINTGRANHLRSWLEVFRTRLHGHLEITSNIDWLIGKSNFSFKQLVPGSQFAMCEGSSWLPFWLPRLD